MSDNKYALSWRDLQREGKTNWLIVVAVVLLLAAVSSTVILSGCASNQQQVEALEQRLDEMEKLTSSLDRATTEQQITLEVLTTEVETMSFHYVQTQNVIMYLSPGTDPFLAWKIAFYTVITADAYGIDPFLVLALMKHESDFNPKARSKAVVRTEGGVHRGARGVMQVMTFWCDDYGLSAKNDYAELIRLDTNIDVGVGVLEESLFECDQDLACALGAYHGSGPMGAYARDVEATYRKIVVKFPRIEEQYEWAE